MTINFEAYSDEGLASFYKPKSKNLMRTNMIVSLDGNFIGPNSSSRDISHPFDLRILKIIRSVSDCVLVGARTALGEKYRIVNEVANGLAATPRLAVVSASLGIPITAPMFESDVKPLIITCENNSTQWHEDFAKLTEVAEVTVMSTAIITGKGIRETLTTHNLHQVVCEGGPKLLDSLIRDDVLDEVCCTISPTLLGSTFSSQPFGTSRRDFIIDQIATAYDYSFLRLTRRDATAEISL